MSDACVNTDMLQLPGWFFVSTRLRSQGYPDGGCREKVSANKDASMPRKCVLCIQTKF
jgi:hypothetical protein